MTVSPDPQPVLTAEAPKASNTIGLVAIILAGLGFLLAVIPPTSGIAWLPLLAATILGIVGVTRKGKPKGTSVAAIIIGVVGWIVSIIVFFVSAVVLLGDAIDSVEDAPSVSQPDNATEEEAGDEVSADAGIGDTVTSGDGVSLTVTGVTCGLTTVGPEFFQDTAKGQFCEVLFTLGNASDETVNLSSYSLNAYIGTAKYETSSIANTFAGENFSTDINPGLSADAAVYFDIPAGSSIETVEYAALFSFDDELVVRVS